MFATARRLLAVATLVLLLTPMAALAGLLDRGPVSATTGYPGWYRDGSPGAPGTPLQLCLSSTTSRLVPPPGNEMCFPVGTSTPLFPGSRGDENFYFLAGALLENPVNGFQARLDLALEAAYGGGAAVRGDEIVFARVRVIIDAPAAGTYVVRHPYGELRFDDVPAGRRAVTFTEDIGIRSLDEALGGKIGPFLEWDWGQADLVYEHVGAPTEVFVGDPGVPHTVTGSPIGFNRFEVSYLGPTPPDLDGAGNPTAFTDLFSVLGQKFTDPIPVPLQVTRARYEASDAPSDNVHVDVWAETDAATGLYLSGDTFRTVEMAQAPADAGTLLRRYHASFTVSGAPPGAVTVSSVADPLAHLTRTPVDDVLGARATHDPASGTLAVVACTSDRRAGAAALFAAGTPLAPDDAAGPGCFAGTIAGVAFPPASLEIASSRGGRGAAPVAVTGAASLAPTGLAVADGPYAVAEGAAPTALAVGANDLDPGPVAGTLGAVVVLTGPAHGTAFGGAGQVLYAPAPLYSGPDRLTYAFLDAAGHLSNAAEVRIDVAPVDDPPVAGADAGSVANVAGQAVTLAVLANDVDPEGGALSVVGVGTPPAQGTVTVNADGTVTYTLGVPLAVAPATITFTYLVSDGVNVVPGSVTVTVTPALEVVQITRADYVRNKRRWRVEGSSTYPGPGNAVTLYSGPVGAAGTQVLATGVPVDGAGLWAWDSGANAPVGPAGSPGIVTAVSTGGATATRAILLK